MKLATRLTWCLMVAASLSTNAAATDTTFTYQGELTENGGPANGTYDLDVSLWDAPAAGGQIGATESLLGVPVTDGRFTIELDFGASAFDNSGRWLQIDVNGVPLSPRHPITRSPYSIQTRGIYVDDANNVGIGTTSPEAPLHVKDGSAGSVTPHPTSTAVLESGTYNYLSILSPDNIERGVLFGDPTSATHGGIIFDSAAAPDGLVFRAGGNVDRMRINWEGDVIVEQRLGVGDPVQLPGQLTITDSGAGSLFAISADSNNSTYPTIFASNTTGPAMWALGASEAAADSGGIVVVGLDTGPNIAIDRDEITARNAGSVAPLHLNPDGGRIDMGPNAIQPAFAYGKVSAGGTFISGSANITSIVKSGGGLYDIYFDVPLDDTDVTVATAAGLNGAAAYLVTDHLGISIAKFSDGSLVDAAFSFVIYRP